MLNASYIMAIVNVYYISVQSDELSTCISFSHPMPATAHALPPFNLFLDLSHLHGRITVVGGEDEKGPMDDVEVWEIDLRANHAPICPTAKPRQTRPCRFVLSRNNSKIHISKILYYYPTFVLFPCFVHLQFFYI